MWWMSASRDPSGLGASPEAQDAATMASEAGADDDGASPDSCGHSPHVNDLPRGAGAKDVEW
jgi:hypothetical protein